MIEGLLSDYYLWIKALHIISMIAWMAGLLYLPRLFVYHCDATDEAHSQTFKVMEYRLLRYIMRPAMIATWLFGLALLFTPGIVSWSSDFWVYGKLACVIGLTVVHERLSKHVREFAEDRNERASKYFRILNEVPTVLMIAIVILVIVKPL